VALITDLIQAAKENADKVHDDQVSDDEWLRHIRNALTELQALVANAYRDTFFDTFDFTLSSPSYSFSLGGLSPKFWRLKGVDSDPDTLQRVALRPFNFGERATVGGLQYPWWGTPIQGVPWCPTRTYHVLGQTLQIQPQEVAAGRYRIYYVRAVILPVSIADPDWALDTELERWVEYVEVAAARRGLWKEESDTRATLDQRLLQMRADILEDAEQDENELSITDVGWGY